MIISAAEMRKTTSAFKAIRCHGKSMKNGRAYWRCSCGTTVIKQGSHLQSAIHMLKPGTVEYMAKMEAFVKVGVSADLYHVCYTNYMIRHVSSSMCCF
ncbi:hypothetical protein DPMN_104914 [Dreissena polymorpha]|uniref:Uncharacterized protein n=1 Tax=Dreissena polymorpha TaxID=45954 RepID=A0A9D4HDZ3_DREPO|nr:hypothetical protein DPMN_104914 [Dreissena polymorpha]